MSRILAVERFEPPFRYAQAEVIRWVKPWLDEAGEEVARRLLSVYSAAGVETRASVVPIEQVFRPGDFEAQNDTYVRIAKDTAIDLARRALQAAGIRPQEIGLVVSVSCTGFMIPAVDAYVADALSLGPRLARLPITESGCAGGVVGLQRAHDFLQAHRDSAVLAIALEFSSLTFQRWDRSATNVVSTAIFGDGGAAAVVVGPDHPRAKASGGATIRAVGSFFYPGTTHLMGFRLRNPGLQIVLDRQLSTFVRREVAHTSRAFLDPLGIASDRIAHWVLHPGGRRIIDVMREELRLTAEQLEPTEAVLRDHGNMSSVTVLFVLDRILKDKRPGPGQLGLLGAFGPGFCAEFALLEF